jgi:hypothetical protein
MWKIPDQVLVQNVLHKNFIGTDKKKSEILNDSDSDGGSFSELSDSDTCEVNSPFTSSSSSEEEEVFQSEPETGRKRTCMALPKHTNTDFELGWKEQTQDGSEICLLQSTRDKYKFPYNSRQFSL